MMILKKIVENKLKEVRSLKKKKPMRNLLDAVSRLPKKRSFFLEALKKDKPIAVIAEIKQRSPSKGMLRKNFSPVSLAKSFEKSGASALSVLTDEKFFGGSPELLNSVRKETRLPILRKDFIIDAYQVFESRLIGADAILLIAAILSAGKLRRLSVLAKRLGLEVLFEVHTPSDVKKVMPLRPKLVGINNRDLKNFRVNLETTERLSRAFSKNVFLVSESGIQSHSDLLFLKGLGVRAVLVGEALMRQKNVRAGLRKLLGDFHGSR